MSKRKTKSRRPSNVHKPGQRDPSEMNTADATTIAWTVSITTVFLCDIAAVAAHFYAVANPLNKSAAMMQGLLLFSAAIIGLISLALLPAVLKLRRTPPPTGFLVFAVCAAAAPILALLVRTMR